MAVREAVPWPAPRAVVRVVIPALEAVDALGMALGVLFVLLAPWGRDFTRIPVTIAAAAQTGVQASGIVLASLASLGWQSWAARTFALGVAMLMLAAVRAVGEHGHGVTAPYSPGGAS